MFYSYISPLLAACALPLLAPMQGSGRDYCRSPLPCTGARRGNPPAHPASGSAEPRHDLRPCLTSAAPAAPVRPPGGSQVCFSLARPLFFPCSLRALCPSSPPCRVAVATIAAPRYPARGLVGAIPPPAPRPMAAPVRPPRGAPHFEHVLGLVDIPLIFH